MAFTIWKADASLGSMDPTGYSGLTRSNLASVAVLHDGTIVTARAFNSDIYMQRFHPDGTAEGPAKIIPLPNFNRASSPVVHVNSDGSYRVTLEYRQSPGDTSNVETYVTKYAANGAFMGTMAVAIGAGRQLEGDAAALTGGGHVAVFTDETSNSGDIKFILFDSDNFAQGTPKSVNTGTVGKQSQPTVTGLSTGGFVVAWDDDGLQTARFRIFDADGNPLNLDSSLPAFEDPGNIYSPKLAALPTGGFVAVWDDNTQGNSKVFFQIFAASGLKLGGPVAVGAASNNTRAEVLAMPDGSFMVAYSGGADPSDFSVHLARYSSDGALMEADTVVSLPGQAGSQADPSLALTKDGRLVVQYEDWQTNTVHMVIIDPRNGIITGTPGNDKLYGGQGADQIAAGDGADDVIASSGSDVIEGGAGTDSLMGEGGDDTIYGHTAAAPDGSTDADNIFGGSGEDQLFGAGGADVIEGGSQTDVIHGGGGNDHLYAMSAADLDGSSDGDFLDGGSGNDTIEGSKGDDLLEGGDGDDALLGRGGRDTASYASAAAGVKVDLANSALQNTLGAGIDLLQGIESLLGSSFADILLGSIGNNFLAGLGGDDQISGGDGEDVIHAGLGSDMVDGGASTDTAILDINPQAGYSVSGTPEDFVVTTAAATDHYINVEFVRFGDGSTMSAAEFLALASDPMVSAIDPPAASGVNDVLTGSKKSDTLDGAGGDDVILGKKGSDLLTGGSGNDQLYGGKGADHLMGGAGADSLEGGKGADVLIGGLGADTMFGGKGPDTFVFSSFLDSLPGTRDVILAFEANGKDHIDLSAIDALPATAGNDTFAFVGEAAFTAAGQVRIAQSASGASIVEINVNADTGADMAVEVYLKKGALDAGDFIL